MHDVAGQDEAHQPLIARIEDEHDHGHDHDHDSEAAALAHAHDATTSDPRYPDDHVAPRRGFNRALWMLTLSAGLSGLLFGFDTGVISSMLVSFGTSLGRPLTTWDKSAITSSTSLLALVFSPLAGYFADSLGRRAVLTGASVLFVVGALLQAASTRVWIMVAGRAVVGAAVGLASAIAPLYIGECSPAEVRGQLVTVQSLFITGGQVVAYVVGWAVQGKWRWAVGAGALPAILQVVLLMGMDESPRWLVQKGREGEAKRVLGKLGGSPRETDRLVKAIREEVLEEDAVVGKSGLGQSLGELVRVPGNRRALTIACMLQGLQQLCGFNSLMYFSATIFSLVGFTSPIGTSLSIALTNFLLTLVAFAIIDRIGRRRILLCSIPFMIVGLAACAVAFQHINTGSSHESSVLTAQNGSNSSTWSSLLLVSLIFYVAAYAVGLGCVPWQQSELFPLSVRSLGSGLATTTNWSANCLTAVTFLPMMQTLGPSLTFVCYAVVCAIGWCAVLCFYPETAGLALEDVGALLKDGWGVWGRARGGLEVEHEQEQE